MSVWRYYPTPLPSPSPSPARYFQRWKYDLYWDFNVYLLTLQFAILRGGTFGHRYIYRESNIFRSYNMDATFRNVYRDNTAYFTECRNPLMNIYSAAREFSFQDTEHAAEVAPPCVRHSVNSVGSMTSASRCNFRLQGVKRVPRIVSTSWLREIPLSQRHLRVLTYSRFSVKRSILNGSRLLIGWKNGSVDPAISYL